MSLKNEMQEKAFSHKIFIFLGTDNKLYLFIPYAGDWANVRDVLDSLGIKIKK